MVEIRGAHRGVDCTVPRGRSGSRRDVPVATMPTVHRLLVRLLLFLLLAPAPSGSIEVGDLPAQYRQWLQMVEYLLTKDELRSFLELEEDYQRDAFIEEFWRTRDPYPSTARNEFKERWQGLAEEALARWGTLEDERARILLLNGPPDAIVPVDCVDLWPAEVWWYERSQNLGTSIALLFYERFSGGRWVLWQGEDLRDLFKFSNLGASDDQLIYGLSCRGEGEEAVQTVLALAQRAGILGYPTLLAEMYERPEAPSGEWVNTFRAYSTEVPEGARTLPAEITVQYPGRRQSRTVVHALITLPREAVAQATLADVGSYNLLATGEVLRDDRLFENFRYRFNLPRDEVTGDTIPLIIERALRPGSYRLILKLEDLNSEKLGRLEHDLEVPTLEHAVPPPLPEDPETRRLLEEAQATLSATTSTLELVPPRGELITGLVRVDTLVTGTEIASVVFDLGGRQRLVKHEPPFSVELDMGNTPQLLTLVAIGLDAAGEEIARDVIDLNSSPHRFDITLIEPHRGRDYGELVRAEARVDVPADQAVDRVEFRVNDELAATVYQAPWVQQLRLPGQGRLSYVSAVAVQPDGNSVEDLVYVNAPDYLDEVDVQFVELYVSVLDREKRPILSLVEDDFAVLEDGAPQQTIRFGEVTNLPIHAGILLDISASMEGRLELAQKAALAFFEQAIQPRDRAALVTFNDRPNLAVKFTNELRDLAGGLAGLKAERGTALFDSLVFGLHYLNGIKGQRALVVLSDGEDEHSRFPFEDALEYARRAGVAIYAIGLDLDKRDARSKLERFAEETGGRAFFVGDATRLAEIYSTIQTELRSRYYLAYQSTNSSSADDFRTVDVAIDVKGAEAKTLRGYYP